MRMGIVSDIRTSPRWTIQLLTAACVLLGLMCLALALMFKGKADEAACYRDALSAGETPAVADGDCRA